MNGDAVSELRVLARTPVLAALGLTVLGSSAMFTVFTYITPILQEVTHASLRLVTTMLVTYGGVGLTVGNWLGGRFANRSVDRTLIVYSRLSLSAVLLLFATPHALCRADGESSSSCEAWQASRWCRRCNCALMSAAADAPNLASAVNIGAFNLGNAIGAALGGAVIASGLGFPAVAIAGAIMSAHWPRGGNYGPADEGA